MGFECSHAGPINQAVAIRDFMGAITVAITGIYCALLVVITVIVLSNTVSKTAHIILCTGIAIITSGPAVKGPYSLCRCRITLEAYIVRIDTVCRVACPINETVSWGNSVNALPIIARVKGTHQTVITVNLGTNT
jgi:hypothetical protein